MHKARAFFYVCAAVFLLALSYHLGAQNASAQAPGNPVVAMCAEGTGWMVAMTANGDTYRSNPVPTRTYSWELVGSVFGGPTPVQQQTWGAVKARYRQPGAAQPTTQDR